MKTTRQTEQPRIYVACLAAYNDGILHGAWIDADQDASEIWTDVWRMLDASPVDGADEWAIHDHEGFEGVCVNEYAGFEEVAKLAKFIAEHGKLGAGLIGYYGGDIEDASAAIEDRYHGAFTTLADYMREATEETTSVPESLRHYIDYRAMARDAEMSGDVFTIETGYDDVHVFSAA